MDEERTLSAEERHCLLVRSHGHTYVFSYRSGQERDLQAPLDLAGQPELRDQRRSRSSRRDSRKWLGHYFALIDYARRPESALGWPEVFVAMQHIAPFTLDPPLKS